MKLFLRLMILFMVMFGMNHHVLAAKKCSRSAKSLQGLPGKAYEKAGDLQHGTIKSVCTNTSPVIMDQEMNEQPVSTGPVKKISLYRFSQLNHYSNPPFAPPRSL